MGSTSCILKFPNVNSSELSINPSKLSIKYAICMIISYDEHHMLSIFGMGTLKLLQKLLIYLYRAHFELLQKFVIWIFFQEGE